MAVSRRRAWLFAVVALVVVIVVLSSGSFQDCVAKIPNAAAYQQQPKGLPHFLYVFLSFFGCAGPFIHENSDAIIAVFTIVLAFSTIALWDETKRLRLGADEQADKMERSVTEAGRSAKAMEGVAESMASNVVTVQKSVGIQREIADLQKSVSELQSRAYIAIQFIGVVPQNTDTKIRFEPRVKLVNIGNTPAYNVRFSAATDVLPHPLPPDFAFPLPPVGGASFIGPRLEKICARVVPKIYPAVEAEQIQIGIGQRVYMWGKAIYEDAFGITRCTKWGLSFYWQSPDNVWSNDTDKHNEAD